MRNTHLLRRALLCVAATTGSLLHSSAEASTTVTIGNGDSLDSLARRYHVPVRAIAKANGITPETILRNGRKIIIPDPPRTVVRSATMRRAGVVKGNRIAIRRGPDQDHDRMALVDHGYTLEVQRKAGDWYQVKTQIGRIGWIKSEFVSLEGDAPVARVVTTSSRAKSGLSTNRVSKGSAGKRVARKSSSKSSRARIARSSRSKRSTRYVSASRSRTHSRSRRPEADAPEASGDVIRTAYAYRGTPYRFGASGKRGFDCSGFTSYIYNKQGVKLPHNAAAQFGHGKRVKSAEMKPGDLVFFHTTRRGISHVGIYAGKGKFVHASSSGGSVRVDSLNSGYYKKRLVGARRVK